MLWLPHITTGVVLYGIQLGEFPWIALGLAATFGFYGLCRKLVPVSPVVGVTTETALLTPLALLIILWLGGQQDSHFTASPATTLLFIGGGIVTSLPLIWFNNAAKLLPLSTLGFFQYLAPTLQLLVGVVIYRETFSLAHAAAFGFIWVAILIYLRHAFSRQAAVGLPD